MATNKIEEITKEGREQLIKEREELLNVKIPKFFKRFLFLDSIKKWFNPNYRES